MTLYTTILLAALQALTVAKHSTQDIQHGCFEYGGAVIQTQAGYYFTEPQRGTEDNLSIIIRFPRGDKIAALYHTHSVCNAKRTDEYFSHEDIVEAQSLNVPSFIWVGYDGKEREYVPGARQILLAGDSWDRSVSPGVLVQ